MKYSYTIILGISLCAALVLSWTSFRLPEFDRTTGGGIDWAVLLDGSTEGQIWEPSATETPEEGERPEAEKNTEGDVTGGEDAEIPVSESIPQEEKEPPARETYFDDALFIGDSRTVGLFEYADMGEGDVFANAGMSIYKIHKARFPMDDQEELTLQEVLTRKQYGKIYLMLGINELGYNQEQTARRYGELAAYIQELQPDARMILEANMHVAGSKSEKDAIYNNANIDAFNEQIRLLAEQEGWTYLDINERFDDENGNLDAGYTADEAHLLGKYYEEWAEWIYEKEIEEGHS